MATYYEEFDTTVGGVIAALKSKILGNAAWSAVSPTPVTFTNTASVVSSGTTFNVSSVAGLFVGQRIKVTVSAVDYRRTITDITGTQITISSSIGVTVAASSTWTTETNILKATTTRGADMIIDLQCGNDAAELNRLNVRFWRTMPASYASASVNESVDRFLWWRSSGGSASNVLHVTLSVSKEHLFIAIEGPRMNESNPMSTSYGSPKNYIFFSDVIPYAASDTVPFIVGGGSGVTTNAGAATLQGSHEVDILRNFVNTASWQPGRLGTVQFPSAQGTDTVWLQRDCTIDGKTYLLPYVLFSNSEGIRGRLTRFFCAGTNAPSALTDSGDPAGSKVSFDGVTYKLIAVNKSENSYPSWGPFGAAGNNSSTGLYRSMVVAVPFSEP